MEEGTSTVTTAPTQPSSSEGSSRGTSLWEGTSSAPQRQEAPKTESAPKQPEGGTTPPPQAPTTPQEPPSGFSEERLAQAILKAQQESQARMQPQKPEYTEEQFRKEFGIFEFDKGTFDNLFGVDATPEQVDMMNAVVKKIVAMSLKMSDYRTQQQLQQVTSQIAPIQKTHQQYQNQVAANMFQSKFPQLKNYTPMVKGVIAQLKSEGKVFKTVDEAIEAAGQRTIAMLQQAGVNLTDQPASQQPTQSQPPQRAKKQPAMVSTGGGVGTTPSASPTQQSKGIGIFKR